MIPKTVRDDKNVFIKILVEISGITESSSAAYGNEGSAGVN